MEVAGNILQNIMEYGVIGRKLPHTFSPAIHAKIGDYSYGVKELEPEELQGFITGCSYKGINVTIPYKQDVIPMLDEIDESAKLIGAVNTIVNRDGRLYGYNTDFAGMKAMIEYNGIQIRGKKVLILGTGGTAKTAHSVAESMGAASVLHASRSSKEGALSYEEIYAGHSDTDIIINTTPCGMYPELNTVAIDISKFPSLSGVVDAVYNPLNTRLVTEAKKRNIPATGGLYMLAAQAVFAAGHFFDKPVDADSIEPVYKAVLREKQNIVLIGMPSCGKTEISSVLAKKLGRTILDTDDEIILEIKEPIADYIKANGEPAFRAEEKAAIERIKGFGSRVIATGGGAILDPDNVSALKQNGVLVFLDRSLEKLITTDSRPLSSTREALEKRFEERYEKYLAASDVWVDGDGTIEEVADQVLTALGF